ncbi:hypothetical protein THERMOS_943 [Bathymodiolus thermophilus thioautotrophic gill symbiont]|uniref:Uncharacterized protein n=1 Tax=Bathymodiolus thermophilus thioautotrophic gill symbiont TaxID=2360 RepID=A0A8H8XCG0_9GAMM|nr:hypothetical protein THERMOS_943 [Bathymodiolus thermophilus thioautotrophic gill symbiont]
MTLGDLCINMNDWQIVCFIYAKVSLTASTENITQAYK